MPPIPPMWPIPAHTALAVHRRWPPPLMAPPAGPIPPMWPIPPIPPIPLGPPIPPIPPIPAGAIRGGAIGAIGGGAMGGAKGGGAIGGAKGRWRDRRRRGRWRWRDRRRRRGWWRRRRWRRRLRWKSRYGLPAQIGLAGWLMHGAGISRAGGQSPRSWGGGEGGDGGAYGPPWHTGLVGWEMHLGSSGPGRVVQEGWSGAGAMDVPPSAGIAVAGPAAPVATTTMSAPAIAPLVIALRTPEALVRLIFRSLVRPRKGDVSANLIDVESKFAHDCSLAGVEHSHANASKMRRQRICETAIFELLSVTAQMARIRIGPRHSRPDRSPRRAA